MAMAAQIFRFNSTMMNANFQLQDEKAAPVVSAVIFDSPTNPVFIPPKQKCQRPTITPLKIKPKQNRLNEPVKSHSSSLARPELSVPLHVSNLLQATAIPVPRTWTGRKQSHLLDRSDAGYFDSLFSEDVAGNQPGGMVRPSRQSSLHVLLSPPNVLDDDDDSNLRTGSETPDSVRSLSLDSIPSLDNDDDIPTPLGDPPTPSLTTPQRLPFVRKQRVFSPSEACPQDHPLLSTSLPEDLMYIDETPTKMPVYRSNSFRALPKLGATVKSNLTASLRAIRSAAQSVSNFTAPSVRSEDFLTRSFFAFSPELTDDKHPVLMKNTPSPALCRYVNPLTISAADIHIYSESPRGTPVEPTRCKACIQMQTYNLSTVKKRRRKCVYLPAATENGYESDLDCQDEDVNDEEDEVEDEDEEGEEDGEYEDDEDDDRPRFHLPRYREPRENGDFLRIVVLEMNMQRRGKLLSDVPGRAKPWLLPRKVMMRSSSPSSPSSSAGLFVGTGGAGYTSRKIPRRWIPISMDDIG
ncbi:hypothetical protein I7I53_03176 [Histoplasma capsulatum var. duboisii H88]|uniref:Uncharacterized protein n=2 Tax=Ajellomyces capsulatus (strain H88) TaxID=544711 RepID=A0A8A1LTC9_AJEC8|nr:hypothetical protein I7I53_03176 [Histoplasma capsulatum var. duboisii H88]